MDLFSSGKLPPFYAQFEWNSRRKIGRSRGQGIGDRK
jgi:hypothetical protein